MKYWYYDLGQQQKERWVVAHLRGSAANMILLDPPNFDRYRFGQPFNYARGGLFTRTPAELPIPWDGHWYLVVDCGGYTHRVHAEKVEMLEPDDSPAASEADTALVGTNA